MPKPDQYIQYRPRDFEIAAKGHPAHVKWGYVVALCYYRCHNHCKGLDDDDEFLRKICEIEREDWEKSKTIIFGGFFQLDTNGLWQHAVAFQDYQEDCHAYERAIIKSKNANEIRWRKKRK